MINHVLRMEGTAVILIHITIDLSMSETWQMAGTDNDASAPATSK